MQRHWKNGKALNKIYSKNWDFVVLQEQSQTLVFNQAIFNDSVKKMTREIVAFGAKPILFMTWERPDSMRHGVTTNNLATAYAAIGRELNVSTAPVGIAFSRSLKERPDLVLYIHDGHPTRHGTYLAACVFYATFLQRSPIGNTYSDGVISAEERDFLQRIAAETVKIW